MKVLSKDLCVQFVVTDSELLVVPVIRRDSTCSFLPVGEKIRRVKG